MKQRFNNDNLSGESPTIGVIWEARGKEEEEEEEEEEGVV